jgi:hypothetical protein
MYIYKRSTWFGDIGAFHPPLPSSAATVFGGREADQAMALAPFFVSIIRNYHSYVTKSYYYDIVQCM